MLIHQPTRLTRSSEGFTLVELIIVIVLLGILATVVTPLVANKFSAVTQSSKRAFWTQQAEYAVTLLRQDLANSVPYSVCADDSANCGIDDQVIEFLAAPAQITAQAARYRYRQLNGFNRLRFNNASTFDVFANIPNLTTFTGYVSIGTINALEARDDWETNMASGSGSLAQMQSATASSNSSENSGPMTTITLSSSHNFTRQSPYYRAYFFQGPVAYQCDTGTGFLYRVSGYTSLSSASFASRVAASANTQKDRVISNLLSCEFSLTAGNIFTSPTLQVRLQIGESNESIELIDTITLSNAP